MPFALRILLVGITLAAIVITQGCGKKAVVDEAKQHWVKIKHAPLEEVKAGEETSLQAEISSGEAPGNLRALIFYRSDGRPYQAAEMTLLEPGRYFGYLPPQARGANLEYYIEAKAGETIVARVPARAVAEAFKVSVKGTPNRYVMIAHVALIFVGLFFFISSGYLGYKSLKDRRALLYIPRVAFLGTITFFIASIPIGMVVAYQTFGRPWTGFPVGRDLTDNKSLAILLYWIVCGFLYRGSLFRKDPSRDLLSMGTMPYVHIVGAVVTAILFALPH